MNRRSGYRRHSSRVRLAALASTSVAGLLIATGAWAQTAAPGSTQQGAAEANAVQEVVVTATRQPELLSKVPVSVAAYTEKTLADLSVCPKTC